MEISFDSGVKEYTIRGVNGIVTVRFNPADVNFAKKAYKTFDDLRKKQETRAKTLEKDIPDDELFDMVDSLDKEMRSIINDLFGHCRYAFWQRQRIFRGQWCAGLAELYDRHHRTV